MTKKEAIATLGSSCWEVFLEIRFSLILKVKRGISCLAKSLRNTCQVVLCTNNDDDDDDDDDIYIYIYSIHI